MALTPAERQRRYRRHKAGDHGACDPTRCGALARQATAAVATPRARPALGDAYASDGPNLAALLAEVTAEAGPTAPPARRALMLVASRLAARLDRLDAYLTGREDAWMRLHSRNEDGSVVEVVVDAALSEARQHDLALRQILADLVKAAEPAKPAEPAAPEPKEPGRVRAGVTDISKRIADRRSSSSA